MHPILQNWKVFLLYLAAWVPLAAILGLLIAVAGNLTAAETAAVISPVAVILAFVCLSPWYGCRALPLRSARGWRLLAQHLAAAMVIAGFVLLIARIAASGFAGMMPGLDQRFRSAAPVLTAMVAMIYLLSIALHYVVIEAQTSRRSELLAREAELKALKAQVNPHFLFNSLNSISALTSSDAMRAREMCIRLADFLRTSLRLGERASIPFREELELTRMYLDVEQVRFGRRLRMTQDVESGCDECQVPALLIQPLVENAVKHGIALLDEGGEIVMLGRRERDGLRFTIENPFDPDAPPSRSGIGLANVRQRLEARYGNAARLDVEAGERIYRVTLTLPMKASLVREL
jgi:two-component system, LytTR family, sensor histidine kinase AlgZ